MPDNIAIKVSSVSKTFKLPHEKQTSLKGSFLGRLRGGGYEIQQAVKNVSFKIGKGEFFGIVGRNGSGKSTLLKCIAGVYLPNEGRIHINGKLVPFIELGVGFNPELSGRDNVYLNGALLGFSRKQMDGMYDDIVAFSELAKFMEQKLKNYSSGMQVRLAFSIAIKAQGDILLLDEVLAVGDAAFQQKCFDYFASLKRDKKTIILVSHSMPMIERFCERALLLEAGEVKHIGTSSEVAGMYEDMIMQEEALKKGEVDSDDEVTGRDAFESSIELRQNGKVVKSVEAFKKFQIVVQLKSLKKSHKVHVGIAMKNSEGEVLFATDTQEHIKHVELIKGKEKKVLIEIDNVFSNGMYVFTLGIGEAGSTSQRQLLKRRAVSPFTVYGVRHGGGGLVIPPYTIKEE